MFPRNWLTGLVILLIVSFGFLPSAFCVPPRVGQSMPSFQLPLPATKAEREYLGISSKKKSFTVSDIDAEVVIVEIFSMYCPHCQRHAPDVNRLHDAIEKDPKLKGKVKIIGIGIGNSAYEVDFFRKKYKIPFPLIPDGEFKLYKKIGVKRTPYFIGVRLIGKGKSRVFYSEPGGFDNYKDFLKLIIDRSGIKKGK